MSTSEHTPTPASQFDLVRISRAKREVGFCANTIRTYAAHGLNLFRVGGATMFSRSQLEQLIKTGALAKAVAAARASGQREEPQPPSTNFPPTVATLQSGLMSFACGVRGGGD